MPRHVQDNSDSLLVLVRLPFCTAKKDGGAGACFGDPPVMDHWVKAPRLRASTRDALSEMNRGSSAAVAGVRTSRSRINMRIFIVRN